MRHGRYHFPPISLARTVNLSPIVGPSRLGRTKIPIGIGKYDPDIRFHAGHSPIRSEQPLYVQPRA